VFIEVAPHAFFRREGNNLSCEVPLNFPTLALGGNIEVPTLDGQEPFKVPEGTQSGTTFRLRGKGMPDVSGRGKGDLFFTVQAVTPKKLSKEQRGLLEQLSKALPKEKYEPRPVDATDDEKNLFDKVKDIFG
jgi:molecular chaperone DnaJ